MAEEIKRKRGRPKKVQPIVEEIQKLPTFSEKYEENLIRSLFQEKLEQFKIEDEDESPYYNEDTDIVHRKREGDWDVPTDENIVYFDPELSYEITGYRPINMTQGLDFDPTPFCEAANTFIKHGEYTHHYKNTKPYSDYWKEQYDRCKFGYTVGNYRITGDHYFFLNFFRMQTSTGTRDSSKAVKGRKQNFPMFAAKQYEFFHYLEMCEYIGKDCALLKARALGFSEILACLGVRPFITDREFTTIYTAAADNQLRPVLDKCWTQLDWLAMNTNGGMKRSRMKIDNILHKRASLVDSEGAEYGRMSNIKGIIADHPRKVRGERTERLIFEEGGSNSHSVPSFIQGNALVELGGEKIGIRIIGGTGGDSGAPLAGLARIFNDPMTFNVLPYKNFYTRDGRVQYTGFFIPAHEFALSADYIDSRGVTDNVRFKKYYETTRSGMEGDDLIVYCAEHCFTPDEALLRQGDNIFDTAAISQRITDLRVHKIGEIPQKMTLIWDKSEKQTDGNDMRIVKAIPSQSSKILILEPPMLDKETGLPYNNLYVAGIDSIDMGTGDSAQDKDVSDFCIVIKKRIHGIDEPKYVAIYKDRPRDIRTAYDTAMKLLTWYNCKALLEYTKISIQMYFKDKGKGHLFMSRPQFAITKGTKKTKELVGVPGTETVIKHALELISIYVNDYCYCISYDEMLEQLLNYNYKDKKKFDIIAAMGMAEIADEELSGITPQVINQTYNNWTDWGYYIDENGYKRKGVIPNKNKYGAKYKTTGW